MKAPLSWVRQFAAIPPEATGRDVADALIRQGLEVEKVLRVGGDCQGPIVVGRVVAIDELEGFRKPIRHCRVDVGPDAGGERGIVCGARNFDVGDLVVVALPGAVLTGGFAITARETYGHVSDGMICSEAELGLGEASAGVIVLPEATAEPGADAGPLLGLGDDVLDVAVTPDRGYALSIRGIAREAACAYGVEFTDPGLEVAPLPGPADAGVATGPGGRVPVECRSDDPGGCRLLTMRTLSGFDASAPSPMWLRSRIRAAGMRPISVVVDVTNYVMLETGQPLHAFDADKIRGTLVARRAVTGERLRTLDGVDRTLSPDDLVIADDAGPVALAGTMGGQPTEISLSSTSIALEAANFDAMSVARMSRRHKLSSEASRRFERGVDWRLAPFASQRAAALLIELAGGANIGMTGQEFPAVESRIAMADDEPAAVAGTGIEPSTMVAALRSIGCDVDLRDRELDVLPPSWRPDLTAPADLVEEVLRLVGYDSVPPRLPRLPAGRGLTGRQRLRRAAHRAAAEFGLVEVLASPFVGPADFDRLGLPPGDERRRVVPLANPLSEERPGMRSTLLPGLLEVAARNVSRGHDSVLLFEAGAVFWPQERNEPLPPAARPGVERRPADAELRGLASILPTERIHLAGVMSGEWARPGWWGSGRPAIWADAIRAAVVIGERIGVRVAPVSNDARLPRGASSAPWHPARTAHLAVGEEIIGSAGELHPRVAAAWGLASRPVAFELDLERLIDLAQPVPSAPAVPTMPVAKEDLAVVVDEDVPAADVTAALASGAGGLLEAIRLFDVYRGPQVGVGRKSLAFTLRFRDPDRTLTTAEVSAARDAALAAAGRTAGATLRS